MKAAVLHANKDLRYEDYPDPVVREGTVKVRVRAAGICGSDIPRVLHGGAHFYPIVLGHEFAGDVVEVGKNVTGVKVDDTVSVAPLIPCFKCGECQQGNYALCRSYSFIGSREQGGFAEYIVIPEASAVKYDPTIPYEQAAMFEPSTVALHGLYCGGYRGGESVAVLGGGTIGVFAMQWAKILGARQVVVFDINDERLSLAKKLGADATINTQCEGFEKTAMALTQGKGFGFVFETAGSPVTMRMAFELAGAKSSLCFIGTPHVDLSFTPKLWEQMNRKEFTLTGSWMSYAAPFPGRSWEMTAEYFAAGRLKFDPALIYKTFPLSQAAQAFALFENPAQVRGKVMLTNS